MARCHGPDRYDARRGLMRMLSNASTFRPASGLAAAARRRCGPRRDGPHSNNRPVEDVGGPAPIASPTTGSGEAPAASASIRALVNAPLESARKRTAECIKPGDLPLVARRLAGRRDRRRARGLVRLWEPGGGFDWVPYRPEPDTPEWLGLGASLMSKVASVSVDPVSLEAGTYPADTLTTRPGWWRR